MSMLTDLILKISSFGGVFIFFYIEPYCLSISQSKFALLCLLCPPTFPNENVIELAHGWFGSIVSN